MFEQKFVLKLRLLKRVIAKLRHLELPETTKNILLIVAFLLAFNALVVVLGASYLSENIAAFLGKSRIVILSDLLFLEGAVILAAGILIAVAAATQKIEPSSEPSAKTTDNADQHPEKLKNLGMLMMIIGAIMIGLSITFGALLL